MIPAVSALRGRTFVFGITLYRKANMIQRVTSDKIPKRKSTAGPGVKCSNWSWAWSRMLLESIQRIGTITTTAM